MEILYSSNFMAKLMKILPDDKLEELSQHVQLRGFQRPHITSGVTAANVLKKEIEKIQNGTNDTFYIVVATERENLGFQLEKFILENLVYLEKCMVLLTTNQSLEPFSKSIKAISMEGNDLLHTPFTSRSVDYGMSEKTRNISMIYTTKHYNRGHYIRKFIYDKYKDDPRLDIFVSAKGETHDEYMKSNLESRKYYRYNLIVENNYDDGYFTERLKDALISQCIPIYWGFMSRHLSKLEELYGVDFGYLIDVGKLGLEETITRYGEDYFDEHKSAVAENRRLILEFLQNQGWDGVASFKPEKSFDKMRDMFLDLANKCLRSA